jgi:hypothetical protein
MHTCTHCWLIHQLPINSIELNRTTFCLSLLIAISISATNNSIDWSSTHPHCARASSINMDTIVPFDNVVDCLRNPPSVHPCPDFTKLRALCLHLIKALKFIECPQSALHGWSGLAMAPAVYALLEPVPFFCAH